MASKGYVITITIIAGAMITIATGLGAWNLSKTASIPETYSTKTEAKVIKDDAAEDRDRIREEIKEGIQDIRVEQRSLKNSVDELNRFLRDKLSHE